MDDASDRNLLFGILAVQLDYVRSPQFMEAANQWMLNKNISLGEVLVSKGFLSEEDRRFIQAIVEKHISRSGSPHNSLEMLQASSAEISDLREKSELLTKGQSSHNAVTEDENPTISLSGADDASIVGERFTIVRNLACGGLGEVFVARDHELDREVALKKVLEKRRHVPEIRNRFVVEAKIAGGLEHPGIVPVYGLGAFQNGAPYYAMRLIRGLSLQDALKSLHSDKKTSLTAAAKNRALRGLIRAVIDACNAVGYANSRGVVHRDIKPHNIMIGKFGETLVVDWGLAKATGIEDTAYLRSEAPFDEPRMSDSAPTAMGSILGTREYMSPEQANGRIDLVDRRSDVFSLGATLFAVLTGRAPYKENSNAENLAAAKACQYQSPRAFHPEIPRSLEAICLKAMAKERKDRYDNAVELAEDLDNWIAGAPVAAYPEPFAQRTMRFARKHQVAVASAFVFLCVASAGLLLSNWAVSKERDRANEASSVATRERDAAEFAKDTTTAILDTFVKNIVDDKWSSVPELDDERLSMVNLALDRFLELSVKAPKDLQISKSVCQLYIRSSNLYRHRGDYEEAGKRLELAHQIAEQLIQPSSGGSKYMFLLTDSQFYLTECKHTQLGAVKALSFAEKSKQLCIERLQNEQSAFAHRAKALSQLLLSEINIDMGDCEAAIREAREGIDLLEKLPVAESQPFVEPLFIASGNVRLARALLGKKSFDDARRTALLAHNQARKGAADNPDVIDFKSTEVEAAIAQAWIEFNSNDIAAFNEHVQSAKDVVASLCESSRTNITYRRMEAEAFQLLGLAALENKDLSAALTAANRSQESLDFIYAVCPPNASTLPIQVITHAIHLHSLPKNSPERTTLEQTLNEQNEKLLSENPNHPALQIARKLSANLIVAD